MDLFSNTTMLQWRPLMEHLFSIYQENILANVNIASQITTPTKTKKSKILKASDTDEIVNQPLSNRIG